MPKLTVDAIAKRAFDAVASKMDGVIQAVSFTRLSGAPVYDVVTDKETYPDTPLTIEGRAVFDTAAAAKDQFGDRVQGETDKIAYLEDMSKIPNEGEVLTIGGKEYTMAAPASVIVEAENGGFCAVLLR